MAISEPLPASKRFNAYIRLALRLPRQPAEGPQFTLPVHLVRAVIRTPVVLAGADHDALPASVVFTQLQWVRRPRLPPAIQNDRGCPLEAAMFA
jgi:hypothetical protein